MKRVIGTIFILALSGALLVYSSMRSLHFIQLTLTDDKQILAYFGLAALDGGLIAWLLAYMYGSSGAWQRATCIIMVVIDFFGAVFMSTADTLLSTGQAGMTAAFDQDTIFGIVIGLSIIIAINIGAAVVHTLTDPAVLEAQAREEANSTITDKARAIMMHQANAIAGELAPALAAASIAEIEAEHLNLIDDKRRRTSQARKPKTANTPAVTISELPTSQEVLPTTSPLLTPKSGRN